MFGSSWAAQQSSVCHLLPVSEQAGTVSSSWVEFRFPMAILSVPLSLQPATGACLLCVSLHNCGAQYVAQTTSSLGHISTHAFPLPIEFPPIRTDPDLITSLPTYLIPCGPFLQPWSYRSFSASLQLNSSKNCSTCRAEIHVFLLHHFYPKPIYIFFKKLFNI